MWTVYATNTCPYCTQAKETLEGLGKEVKYIILTSATLNEYLDTFPTAKTVPQIITPDGDKIGGLDALLEYLKD